MTLRCAGAPATGKAVPERSGSPVTASAAAAATTVAAEGAEVSVTAPSAAAGCNENSIFKAHPVCSNVRRAAAARTITIAASGAVEAAR